MGAKRVLKRLAIFAGLFFAGIFLFNKVLMPALVKQGAVVIVPDLRNSSEKEAREQLEKLGLVMRVERSDYDTQVPVGFVVSQQPEANATLKPGRSIGVVMSLGTRVRMVPDVRGVSARQARNLLQSNGLDVGRIARVQHIGDTRESVVATSPPIGDEVHEGEQVDIVVSVPGGTNVFLMPDLTMQDLFFVRQKLEKMGFRVASVRYEDKDGVYPNTIIDQNPEPGEQIRQGESIELVASSSK